MDTVASCKSYVSRSVSLFHWYFIECLRQTVGTHFNWHIGQRNKVLQYTNRCCQHELNFFLNILIISLLKSILLNKEPISLPRSLCVITHLNRNYSVACMLRTLTFVSELWLFIVYTQWNWIWKTTFDFIQRNLSHQSFSEFRSIVFLFVWHQVWVV